MEVNIFHWLFTDRRVVDGGAEEGLCHRLAETQFRLQVIL